MPDSSTLDELYKELSIHVMVRGKSFHLRCELRPEPQDVQQQVHLLLREAEHRIADVLQGVGDE